MKSDSADISANEQIKKICLYWWKDFINFLFTEEPLLSDNDPGIGLLHQQIDNIPE